MNEVTAEYVSVKAELEKMLQVSMAICIPYGCIKYGVPYGTAEGEASVVWRSVF